MFRFLFFIILSVTLATAGCRSTAPEPPPTPPPAPEPEQVEISDKTYSDAAVFALAMEILRKNYVDPDRATDARLLENALTGLAGELDPYSGYEPPAQFTENDSKRTGELVGIGVEVVKSANQPLLITGVMPGSPAQKGGLRPGDRIVEISGKPTARLPMQECLNLTRGKEGSEVELKYSRDAAAEPLAIRLTRAMIVRPSIPADAVKLLPGHIGYIKIESFTGHTPEEFRAALRKLKAQKLDGLILDLRNNPGGLVGSAVEIASIFLPENELILRTRDRHGRQTHEIRSTGDQPRELELPVVILTSPFTASSSELFSGALQDHKRARLVGMRTFGKGTLLRIVKLPNGGALRYANARYHTPLDHVIERRGLTPDVEVRLSPGEIFRLSEQSRNHPGEIQPEEKGAIRDIQLEKALELLTPPPASERDMPPAAGGASPPGPPDRQGAGAGYGSEVFAMQKLLNRSY